MRMDRQARNVRLRFAAIGFIAGAIVAAGVALTFFTAHQPSTMKALRESDISSSSGYTFTDPLIGLSSGSANNSAPEYAALEAQINTYIASQGSSGLSSASVKFGDIEDSEGFTINPDETYDPASLTKVPLAMSYYALAETDPSILAGTITYPGDPDLDASEQVKSATQLVPGQSYTVEELIEHMIRYSDNNAEQLLADHLSTTQNLDALNSLFADLGIKTSPDDPDYMTVQSASLFLRVLFNATYLDRSDSEKLLQLLSQTDFTAGLRSGVPGTIPVAEKFGDARIPNTQGTVVGAELQNCGIIYYPDHPYLLCIMTKGASIPDLERVISGISQMVFQNVEDRYPTNQP
jgi:beta-lactamase class A